MHAQFSKLNFFKYVSLPTPFCIESIVLRHAYKRRSIPHIMLHSGLVFLLLSSLRKHFLQCLLSQNSKAVIFETNGGKLEYKDIPVPTPKANELLIHVKYSGVCHTDLHAWHGDWPLATKLPLVGGHEGAGVVVGMGENVKGWKIGDFAGIKWLNGSCMACEFCQQGAEPNCAEADLSGYTHDGSFQQYATADAVQAAKIPAGTDLANVAPILCAGVTVYKALKTADLSAGQWVAISGAGGGLGSLAVQYAVAMGLRVLGIDGGEEKGDFVKSLGAEVYVDFLKEKTLSVLSRKPLKVVHMVLSTSLSLKEPLTNPLNTLDHWVKSF